MALKKIYFGSLGPYLYDDTDDVNDPDGDFSGLTRKGIVTDDQIYVGTAPTSDDHVVRLTDVSTTVLNKYIIETGVSVVIGTNEQTLLIEQCVISGTGSLTINGTGILAILN